MPKLKAIYWDERTLFTKEKLDEYTIVLAELIKKWDPAKYDGTAFKLMSYFEEMKKVLDILKEDFGEKRSIDDVIKRSDISSYTPVTDELKEDYSVWATDRWGVAFIMNNEELKTMKIKDMILS